MTSVPRRQLQSFDVIALVVVNVAVFIYQRSLTAGQHAAFDIRYGAVPVLMREGWRTLLDVGPRRDVLSRALPVITANYLHVNLDHLCGNMLFLWVFAHVVSQAVGRTLNLVVYVLAGTLAVIAYVQTNPTSEVPMMGASGAIAGLEGAYFALALRWRMPHGRVWPFEAAIPAWCLALLAIANFVLDTGALFSSHQDFAVGAHLGGFVGGAFIARIISTALPVARGSQMIRAATEARK